MIGFALALGGGKVYEAETLVAMGQPFSPNGGAPVQSFLDERARRLRDRPLGVRAREGGVNASGLRVRALRGNVTLRDRRRIRPRRPADGRAARDDQGDRGAARSRPRRRPTRSRKEVITRTSAQYVDTKIKAFNDQLALDSGPAEHARAAYRAARAGRERAGPQRDSTSSSS